MSGAGAPIGGDVSGEGLSVALVATRWYPEVTDALLAGARKAAEGAGVRDLTEVRVPGAFELPVVAQQLAAGADAVVCLGAIVRGGTPHFDYLCRAVTDGCTRVALDAGTPVGFGVLTCDTIEQALDRAGLPGSREDKGREATLAAVEAAVTLRRLRHRPTSTGF